MAHLFQRPGKAAGLPEKSNFAQTCNLLSQFMKERGIFANKGPEAPRTPATTLNLLPSMEQNSSVSAATMKPVHFPPQFVGTFGSPNSVEDSINRASDLRKSSRVDPGTGTAQMTIFYGGQVIVFDDFPAEKVKEIMGLASKSTSNATSSFISTSGNSKEKANSINSTIAPSPNKAPQGLQLRPQADGSDLPIARRASLHRFFEKRKDRVASKAPYQRNNQSSFSSSAPRRPEERSLPVFIDLECRSPKQALELKL